MNKELSYWEIINKYERFPTREVFIGEIPLGAKNPIRIQSMTTTNTLDTSATVAQTIELAEAGCEYVRITTPTIKDAENLTEIKKELKKKGYNVPLIADVHYTPRAAEIAARIVEKVRVNPGNYIDKKKFQLKEYDDYEYEKEIDKIRERFTPLVKICKEYGTALRIGANHGSLSDRILSRYGDTPEGMVESALEFVRICEENNFRDIVLSMKASNTRIMVAAYRLLITRMASVGMNYPIHLGVTEAGDGLDGRVKSAVGIGSLLADGIGDTIRVSLTEPPVAEIPTAKILAKRFFNLPSVKNFSEIEKIKKNPFHYSQRKTFAVSGFGDKNFVSVIFDDTNETAISKETAARLGISLPSFSARNKPDFIVLSHRNNRKKIVSLNEEKCIEVINLDKALNEIPQKPAIVEIKTEDVFSDALHTLKNNGNIIFLLKSDAANPVRDLRNAFFELEIQKIENPVIIYREYDSKDEEELISFSATDFGSLLLEGYGNGVWLKLPERKDNLANEIAFAVLQASRVRITKTEYIACPSCGRTLFDLVEVTNKIREKTSHLTGLKIGIMGCIVNGPGEMADADYGYVGAGPGKITLYKGQTVVKRNIPSETAVDELINLIKENGDWQEPKT